MKISIITATYNSLPHLTDALKSIEEQSCKNIEHIIIDGGSTDGTTEFIEQANQVDCIISEPDLGIYDALNKGLSHANGDIIGFLHSDDMLDSTTTLENIVRIFSEELEKSGKKPDVVYGDLVFVDQYDPNKIVRYWKSRPFKPELLQSGWMPPHPTIFMRREVYEKHGLFNINLKCAADYDYILRVFRDNTLTFSYLPEIITKMRMGGISTKGFKNLFNKMKEDYWVLKQNQMPFPLWILGKKNFSKIPQLVFKQV